MSVRWIPQVTGMYACGVLRIPQGTGMSVRWIPQVTGMYACGVLWIPQGAGMSVRWISQVTACSECWMPQVTSMPVVNIYIVRRMPPLFCSD